LFEQFSKNKIMNKLILGGNISEKELKKIYRDFCKKTHPDLTGKASEDFLIIQKEYEEAKKYLSEIILHERESNLKNPRIMLHTLLYSYNIYGLHSSKIRRKEELKERNISLTREIIFWGKIYDPEFVTIFIEYNKKHIKSFTGWEEESIFKKGRDLFLKGLIYFFEYEAKGNLGTLKIASMSLHDAIFELNLISSSSLRKSIFDYTNWILKELELPPSNFKA
jgi:hypothetical protein